MAALRRGLSQASAEEAARAVFERLLQLEGFDRVERIGLYAATAGELPTRAWFSDLTARGKRCLFPRCTDEGTLEFAEAGAFDELAPGRYGVLEPVADATRLRAEDWVIVPGMAFDERGGRLGRGRAYYDRTFPAGAVTPLRIGVALEAQCVDALPMDAHDRPVDVLLTESRTRSFRAAGGHGERG